MGELTADLPKPMLPAGGRPILESLLDRLIEAGYSEAAIVTGYRADSIEDYFRHFRSPLRFLRQTCTNGTATAALVARDFTGADDFLLTFGDILAPAASYREILDELGRNAAIEAVVGVKEVADPYQGAAVYADSEGWVTRIVEKPRRGESSTPWNSAGLYAVRPTLYPELERTPLSARGEYELTSAIARLIECGKRLRLYPITGPWRDIGRPEDLAAVRETR